MNESVEAIEDAHGVPAYYRLPATIVKGKGASVWDSSGKEYLDFMTGYGVALVGHSNDKVREAIITQAERLLTCHGSFYNDTRAGLLERLAKVSPKGLTRALLTNSGTETVEAAIKLARRHTRRRRVVSMKGGFHGKTLGSLSATWNKKYRENFGPLLEGFDFAEFGDGASLSGLVGPDTAAVILEPIQGESGVLVPPKDYLREVKEICERSGALLILDEIQTGLGRTGKMWASEHFGIVPDIMTVSKGLGGGIPIGAAMTADEVAHSLTRGEHTSTFAGNPLACAAASATLDFIAENNLPSKARGKGDRLREGLDRLASTGRVAKEVRGMGLMLALQTRVDIHEMLLTSLKRGVIFGYSGRDTFRFLPPLVIEDHQIERGLSVLAEVIAEDERRRSA